MGPFCVWNHFDRKQQVGRALDFIDDGSVETTNETDGIGSRGGQDGLIVQRDIAAASSPFFRTSVVFPARRQGYLKGLVLPGAQGNAYTCLIPILRQLEVSNMIIGSQQFARWESMR